MLPVEYLRLTRQPIQTEWIVITGTVSAGKTTVINQLLADGYQTRNEVPLELIEQGVAAGVTESQIFAHQSMLQDAIIAHQFERHARDDPRLPLILDRGLPDPIAFGRALDYPEAIDTRGLCSLFRYKAVILLEPAPLNRELERVYSSLEYPLLRVPSVAREEDISDRVKSVKDLIAQVRSTN